MARGLLAPQPTPGQTASAAALAAEAHARAVAVALQRGRPVNIVGAWSPAAEAQAAAGLESGGASWKESPSSRLGGGSAASGGGGSWHYDAASPCDAPTAIDRTLSFAKSAAVFSSASSSSSGIEGGSGVSSGAGSGGSTGCARYAVAVGGDLGHFGNSLGSFEENVVNAAHGDVDVFFYVSLDSPNGGGGNAGAGDGSGRSGNGGKLRGEQVKLLRLLKKDYGPKQKAWAIAAVVEAASNATMREVSSLFFDAILNYACLSVVSSPASHRLRIPLFDTNLMFCVFVIDAHGPVLYVCGSIWCDELCRASFAHMWWQSCGNHGRHARAPSVRSSQH